MRCSPVPVVPILACVLAVACGGSDAGEAGGPQLVAGTQLELHAADEIVSRRHHTGDAVTAVVTAEVVTVDGDVVIPAGAEFAGTITAIEPSDTPGRTGLLRLTFTTVRFGGKTYPISVTVRRYALTARDVDVVLPRGAALQVELTSGFRP